MPDLFTPPAGHRKVPARLFSTFVEYPSGIRFRGQNDREEILLLLRKHWITNLGWILVSLFLLITPVVGLPFVNILDLFPFPVPITYVLAGYLFWYLGTFGFILLNFLFWFYNVNIITTERIVDVDFIYLLYNEISSTVISKVEDVTYKRAGLISSIFDYGNVFVQTAGTVPNIEFLEVPKPSLVAKIITGLLERRT